MNRFGKLFVLFVALALIAVACGGSDPIEQAAVEETTTTTQAPPETTTTEPATTTTTEPPPTGPVLPLTGEVVEGAFPDHAAVVVKISNNDAAARSALNGLDLADLVYEERIEVDATRFAAVFHSVLPEQVGSVRSGRTSDIQIVANLNQPVFGFSGANDGVHDQLRQAEADGILIRRSADFGNPELFRISDFAAPNNTVADVSRLLEAAPEDSGPPDPVFDYSANVVELGEPSPGVRVDARSEAQYVWSDQDGGYLRFQGEEPHVTRNGNQITPANVIILTTTYVPSQVDPQSQDAITIGEGQVEVYSGGSRVVGTWTREFSRDPYTLTTADGDIIGLQPGQTWVSLSPAGTSTEMTQSDAADFLSGDTGSSAQGTDTGEDTNDGATDTTTDE